MKDFIKAYHFNLFGNIVVGANEVGGARTGNRTKCLQDMDDIYRNIQDMGKLTKTLSKRIFLGIKKPISKFPFHFLNPCINWKMTVYGKIW